MQRVVGEELEELRPYFELAARAATKATCTRAKCGSVIVKDGEIIGRGYNSPPLDDEGQRMCDMLWDSNKRPKYDLTCCVHAEWRAVLDACRQNSNKIGGSRLYFMRIDENGDFTDAGLPYCTTCSRFTMESGVGEFVLWNNNGADLYDLTDYNKLSYNFFKRTP